MEKKLGRRRGQWKAPDEVLGAQIAEWARANKLPFDYVIAEGEHLRIRSKNELLEAAGSSIRATAADDPEANLELWAIARACGLSEEEFDRITHDALLKLIKRHYLARKQGEPQQNPTERNL